MMKNRILSIAGICLLTAAVCALTPAQAEDSAQPKASAPAQAAQTDYIYLADPTIFYDQGTYYLYGTGNSNEGFWVYTSPDLKTWKGPAGAKNGYALIKGDSFGSGKFWAPQVFRYKDLYYMAYAADEYIAIASAKSPLGPFTQEKPEKIPCDTHQIDPYIFFDDDGKVYFYHVRLDRGNRIYVAEMTPDLRQIKKETLRECVATGKNPAEAQWENTNNQDWGVIEGPTVIKRDGIYYLFYSANDYRSPDYAVGYATASSPLGPWTRYGGSPILNRKLVGENGTGHGDIFEDASGKLFYVFHTHKSNDTVHNRRTAVAELKAAEQDGKTVFSMDRNSFRFFSTEKRH